MGSWKGRENQYIQFVRVLYCKLSTNGKRLPAIPLEAMPGTKPRPLLLLIIISSSNRLESIKEQSKTRQRSLPSISTGQGVGSVARPVPYNCCGCGTTTPAYRLFGMDLGNWMKTAPFDIYRNVWIVRQGSKGVKVTWPIWYN